MRHWLTISTLVLSVVVILAADLAMTAPPRKRYGTRPGSYKYLPPPEVQRQSVDAASRRAPAAQPSGEFATADIAVPVRRIYLSPAVKGAPERVSLLRGCR